MIVVFIVGMLASCTRPSPAPPIIHTPPPVRTGPVAPIAAWFGTWDDNTKFERKNRIDNVEGQAFGWRIKTRCTGPLKFREVMRLPGPGDWTSFESEELPGTTISDDQTTTTTIDYAACRQGWVEHQWTVAASDPAGTYVITVELDGYATQTFRPRFDTGE